MKMNRNLIAGIITMILCSYYSANLNGQITMEKEGMKKHYLHEGEQIDNKQLASLLAENPSSVAKYKLSKTYSIAGLSSIAVGTCFIGVGFYYTIKSAQASNEGDLWGTTDYSNKSGTNMLIGAGFYLLSVPFMIMSNSNLKKSITLFNSSANTSGINKLDLYFGFTDDGLGVGLKF
jgi:hypothetical protein